MAKKYGKKTTSVEEYYHTLDMLAEKGLNPVMLVYGSQDYFRHKAIEKIEKAAKSKTPDISVISFQGPASANESGLKVGTVLDELSSYGLFASNKLVIIRRAQRFLFPQKNNDDDDENNQPAKEEALEKLLQYIESPAEGMSLVLELQNIDKRKKAGKKLVEHSKIIECPELRWDNEVISWIRHDIRERGHTITSGAANMLYTLYGSDPGVISAELDKLSIFIGKIPQITEDDVKEFMGEDIALTGFELINAIEERNTSKAVSFARQYIEQGLSSSGKNAGLVGSVHMAFGSLRGCLMRIWQAHEIVSSGGGISAIENDFRVRGRRAEALLDAGRKYNLFDIKNAFEKLSASLARLHDTGSDPALELERAVLDICRKKAKC